MLIPERAPLNTPALFCLLLGFVTVDRFDDPLESVIKSLPCFGRHAVDLPRAVADIDQVQLLCDILGRKGVVQVLLVGKNENGDSGEFFVFDEFVHLNSSLFYTLLIGTVNDVNESICVIVVVLPVGANSFLTPDIPHIEFETVFLNGFDVEALCRHDMGDLFISELLEDTGFASVVKTEQQNAVFGFGRFEFSQ
eukprot:CAMPEP_0175161596 /NCGR_PEP_ID=MMETSP0087-20121206/24693_1 /TAXON_ID=136419 /ORGANISM="Unknown Unknown, Strain D1" /LENGTH=194 /DNA_ID=CAMNT_0016450029 /DNA_START=403 /DNA_END=990 /DNA_ORIENTATION=+